MKQYYDWKKEYQQKYNNAQIWTQCGQFAEFYSQNLSEIQALAQILNISYTKRNKKEELSNTNPFLVGVPLYAFQKHLNILQKQFTVILAEEIGDNSDGSKQREITQIFSPGTILETHGKTQDITTYLTQLYIEIINKNVICGVSQIDVKSGQVLVQEVQSGDYSMFMDELKKITSKNISSEIIINIVTYKKQNLSDEQNQYFSKQRFLSYLHLDQVLSHFYINEENQGLQAISRQNDLFKQVYSNIGIDKTQLQPIEFLDLEKLHYAAKSLAYLLFFTLDHNQTLTTYLKKPQIQRNTEYLQLEQNTIDQIDLFTKKNIGKISSIFDCVNKCQTTIGKRQLRHQLANPICCIDELNHRYDIIEDIDKLTQEEMQQVSKSLSNVIDIQLLQRKINLKMITPQEFDSLIKSYNCIKHVLSVFNESDSHKIKSKIFELNIQQNLQDLINDIEQKLDLTKVTMCTSIKFDKTENFFKEGQICDQSNQLIEKNQQKLNEICEYYNQIYEKQTSICQKNLPNKLILVDGNYWLVTTKNKFDIIMKGTPEDDKKQLIIRYLQSQTRYSTPQMFQISSRLLENKSDLIDQIKEHYFKFLKSLSEQWSQFFDQIIMIVQMIDIALSGHKLKHNCAYTRPNLIESDGSFIEAKQLRHPIVENLDGNELFVPNDIILNNENMGNIIFGINGSGKSVLLKSISATIILSQSGLYVPCKHLNLGIYNSILTQINSTDNVFQQKSSFMLQMNQIKNMLTRAGSKSLVISDELLSTTNATCATALFCSMCKHLMLKNTQFIFSTHLENLDQLDILKQQNKIKYKHLQVQEKENGQFVYLRKLVDGVGPQNYGVNVAKSLGLPKEFIDDAQKIQNEILGYSSQKFNPNPKKSRYNSKVLVYQCQVCKHEITRQDQIPLTVHHISWQKDANKYGIICDYFHKNKVANQSILCLKCHQQVNKTLFIYGYKQTSNGIQLDYKWEKQ